MLGHIGGSIAEQKYPTGIPVDVKVHGHAGMVADSGIQIARAVIQKLRDDLGCAWVPMVWVDTREL